MLNSLRQVFRFPVFERILIWVVRGFPFESLFKRLVPPNYLYPNNTIREVERDGIRYLLDISDYVEHAVYFGSVDPAQEELRDLAIGKGVIVDVGVNIGSVSLMLATFAPNARIYGFEPDPKNFAKARHNVALNGNQNISLINKGLGADRSSAKLFNVNKTNNGMNRILLGSAPELAATEYCEIEIIKFDDFAMEEALDRIDLIKIDVEGYELRVLEGAKASLRRFTPDLFIELDDDFLREQGDSASDLISFLEKFDYDIHSSPDGESVTSSDDFAGCHFDIVCRKRASTEVR